MPLPGFADGTDGIKRQFQISQKWNTSLLYTCTQSSFIEVQGTWETLFLQSMCRLKWSKKGWNNLYHKVLNEWIKKISILINLIYKCGRLS